MGARGESRAGVWGSRALREVGRQQQEGPVGPLRVGVSGEVQVSLGATWHEKRRPWGCFRGRASLAAELRQARGVARSPSCLCGKGPRAEPGGGGVEGGP